MKALFFFDNGSSLMTVTDRETQTHIIGPDALIREACGRLTRNLDMIEWLTYLGAEPPRRTCENLPEPWSPGSGLPEP